MSLQAWSPQAITGLLPGMAPATQAGAIPSIGRSAGPTSIGDSPPWHPDNPLFWFAGLAAVTIGLIAVNTSVRVGPFKASAGAGKS